MAGQTLSIPRSLGALFDIGVVGDLLRWAIARTVYDRPSRGGGAGVPRAGRAARADGPAGLSAAARRPERRRGRVPGHVPGAAPPGRGDPRPGLGRRLAARGGRAGRVARRVESARRRRIERRGIRPAVGRNDDPDRLDLGTLIDDELARLPEKYRAADRALLSRGARPTKARPSGSAGRSARCGADCRGPGTCSGRG